MPTRPHLRHAHPSARRSTERSRTVSQRGPAARLGLLVALAALAVTSVPAAQAVPSGGAAGASWTATHDGPQQYPDVHIDWDVPIRMSDGTVLKANVYRPIGPTGMPDKTPVVLNMTPYTKLVSMVAESALSIPGLSDPVVQFFRSLDMTGTPLQGLTDITGVLGGGLLRNFSADRNLIRSGYTQIVVDVRGTGFSQGVWEAFGQREQTDTVEVIDWASKQPWSNGKVGMSGLSYSAINQLQAAEKRPPALQAIFAAEPGSDLIRDIGATGGGLGFGFIVAWMASINSLKLIPDLHSILTGKFDWRWLSDRAVSPLSKMQLILEWLAATDIKQLPPVLADGLNDKSPLRQAWLGHPERITVPAFITGGWHDIFTNSEPEIYNAIKAPPGRKKLLMGNTYHVTGGADMGRPGTPPRLDVLQRAWFDKWLKGIDNGIDKYDPVTLWQQGGGWTSTTQFPRPGVEYQRMYLSPVSSGSSPGSGYDGTLSLAKPTGAARLTVAPTLLSICSRDTAIGTGGASAILTGCTQDSRIYEKAGLTFTSDPVQVATPISGSVNVHLNTVLDAPDGYWTATLNDVAPDGKSTVLTTGQLVSSLRMVNDSKSKKSRNGDYTDPYQYLSLDRRQPNVAGQPVQLDVGLSPTDAILQPGHRLRVDIFASNFPRGLPTTAMLVESGLKPQHLVLDPNAPSFINVAFGSRPGWR